MLLAVLSAREMSVVATTHFAPVLGPLTAPSELGSWNCSQLKLDAATTPH